MGPKYALDDVKAAAAVDRFEFAGKRVIDRVSPWLRSPLEVRAFAAAVLQELSPGDFCGQVTYDGGIVCDEYGIAISAGLQEHFGIGGLVTWYVKLRIEQRRGGKLVVMASLHAPERDFDARRVGGRLTVKFEPREP